MVPREVQQKGDGPRPPEHARQERLPSGGPQPGAPGTAPRPGQLPPGPPLPPGTWWRDPGFAAQLGIDPRQVDDLDAAFDASRASLADARAALEREERSIGALLPSPTLDLDAALAASRRVAHARAQLDRAFLELRFTQWRTLRAEQRERLLHPPPQ
jgi:Spy/CpxP family protein refolding chaperone